MRHRHWVTFGWILAATFGCAPSSSQRESHFAPITSDNTAAQEAITSANNALDSGDHKDAERRYRDFLDRFPSDRLAPIAALGLGHSLRYQGKHQQAMDTYRLASRYRNASVREMGAFYEGVSLAALGRHTEAIEKLEPFFNRTTRKRETLALLRALAISYEATAQVRRAVITLDVLMTSEPDAETEQWAKSKLTNLLSETDRQDLDALTATLTQGGYAWAKATTGAAKSAYAAGQMGRVRELTRQLRKHGFPFEAELETIAISGERTKEMNLNVIGAVLPLSGRARDVGKQALRGILLATGLPGDAPHPTGGRTKLVFRDDQAKPELAARAVESLTALYGAAALIGPLSGPSAVAAAERAEQIGVPMVVLTPSGAVRTSTRYISRLFPTLTEELETLYSAARSRGAKRVIAVCPRSPVGDAIANATRTLSETNPSFTIEVVQANTTPSGLDPLFRKLASKKPDAMMIGGTAETVELFAPAWAASTARGAPSSAKTQLLVPSIGFDERLLSTASRRYLQNAILSIPFSPSAPTPASTEFDKAYRERYGTAPSQHAALAYDATRLVLDASRSRPKTRDELAEKLRSVRPATIGPSGGITNDGRPNKKSRLWMLRGDRLEPLRP